MSTRSQTTIANSTKKHRIQPLAFPNLAYLHLMGIWQMLLIFFNRHVTYHWSKLSRDGWEAVIQLSPKPLTVTLPVNEPICL